MRDRIQSASPKAHAAYCFKVIAALMASVLMVALSACAAQPQSGQAETEQAPLAKAYEYASVSAEGQQWPVRGQFYVPEGRILEEAPLVIVNHLRFPTCTDDTFAYSCPGGEYRYDEGMSYLGEALAHAGYAVLIPDLGAVWEGGSLYSPYDQPAVWQAVVTAALEENAPGYAPQEVGMFVHSRAAGLVNLGVQQFGVDSVFAYGPYYDTFDQQEFSPPAPDVPYLAIDSIDDQDVGPAAAIWMTQHITKDRNEPAYVATLNGFGHTLINQTLVSAGKDDRVACDLQPCASVEEHQNLVRDVALDWFGQTLSSNSASSDSRSQAHMPAVPAALAAMNPPMLVAQVAQTKQETVARILPKNIGSVCSRGIGDSAQTAAMCPEPDVGLMMAISEVSHITSASNVSVDVMQYKQTARKIAVHVAPFGSSPDGSSAALELSLRFTDGRTLKLSADGSSPALKNRETDVSSGVYIPATIEFALPKEWQEVPIAEIELSASKPVEVRGIDVVGEKQAE